MIRRTNQFKKDAKRALKRGKKLTKLRELIERLAAGQALPAKYRDHPLAGGYRGARECHIEPDWLLIYANDDTGLILIRTGSHADLFE